MPEKMAVQPTLGNMREADKQHTWGEERLAHLIASRTYTAVMQCFELRIVYFMLLFYIRKTLAHFG